MICNAEHACRAIEHATANHAPTGVVLLAAVLLPVLVVAIFALGAIYSTERS